MKMSETFEEMIDASVDKFCGGPLDVTNLTVANANQYLRVGEEVERGKTLRKAFFRGFFERHPEWRIMSLVAPNLTSGGDEGEGNVIAYTDSMPWPLTDEQILQAIADMQALGWFIGEPRTAAEIKQIGRASCRERV